MWKTHASTWESALRELPSQKLYQRATGISKPLPLRGKLHLYSTGPLVAAYKRYNICDHIWTLSIIYSISVSVFCSFSDMGEHFISPCGGCRQFMREASVFYHSISLQLKLTQISLNVLFLFSPSLVQTGMCICPNRMVPMWR